MRKEKERVERLKKAEKKEAERLGAEKLREELKSSGHQGGKKMKSKKEEQNEMSSVQPQKSTEEESGNKTSKFFVTSKKHVLDLNDSFGNIWFLLKQDGWTYTTGKFPYDWYYLKPGVQKATGKLGVDMFGTEQDVIDHCRVIGMHGQALDIESSSEDELDSHEHIFRT